MPSRDRNVVVVVVDALRRDRVGSYVDGESLTPNIDSLADEGTVFENAFSAINTTDPSVTSLHSGKHPESVLIHHGPYVTDAEKQHAEAIDTVPELLQSAGYRTVAAGRLLGRWHKAGFEEYPEETLDVHTRRSLGQVLERISPTLREVSGAVFDKVMQFRETVPASNEIDTFLDLLGDEPFYGVVHMMDTHVPYEADEELVADLLARREYPNRDLQSLLDEHEDNPYLDNYLAEHVTEADFEIGLSRLLARYDAAVVNADRKVGQLVDGLRDRGCLDETTLIVTSDHGESLTEHGIYFEHHGLYDQSIRVPMIVSGPDVTRDICDEFVQIPDLAPTILEQFGVNRDLSGTGRQLQPLLTGSGEWDSREFVVVSEAQAQRRIGIRTDRYKFIKHVPDSVLERERDSSFRCGYCDTVHGAERELYDLSSDPGETENIVTAQPDVASRLESQLDTYLDDLEQYAGAGSDIEYEQEDEILDRLEDLGYR